MTTTTTTAAAAAATTITTITTTTAPTTLQVLSTPRVRPRGSDSDGGDGSPPSGVGTTHRTSSGGTRKNREALEKHKARLLKMAEAEKMQPKHRLFDYFTIVTKNNPGGKGASGTGGMPKLTCVFVAVRLLAVAGGSLWCCVARHVQLAWVAECVAWRWWM
jgi:hypothetical protein